MIETNEYRVRPVVRYVVTHYHSYSTEDGKGGGGGSEVVGEFDNEAQAEKVKAALEDTVNGYVIFRRSFEVPTDLYYAQTIDEAKERRNALSVNADSEWIIAKRVAAPDAALALHRGSVGFLGRQQLPVNQSPYAGVLGTPPPSNHTRDQSREAPRNRAP